VIHSKVSRSRCSSSFKNQICFVVSYYLHTYICFACVVNVCFATASKKPLDPPASNSIPLPSRGFNDVLRLLRAVGIGGRIPLLPFPKTSKDQGLPPRFSNHPAALSQGSAAGLRGRLAQPRAGGLLPLLDLEDMRYLLLHTLSPHLS